MRISDIDLRLLRVFKAVAEAGGFARARDELGISQPAISSHIANLEQRLNVRLCNRGRQGFSMTAQGQKILDETNALLSHLDLYANRLNEIGQQKVQSVRLGVVDCLVTDANNPLPSTVKTVAQDFPDLQVRVGIYDYLDCLTELRASRLDIAIVGFNAADLCPEDLDAKHIYDEPSGLFCAPDHPCSQVEDPDELQKVLRSTGISAYSFLANPMDEALDFQLLEEKSELSQNNVESTVYLALAGTSVGLIPLHYADQWVRKGKLVAVAPDRYRTVSKIHAVRMKSVSHSDAPSALWKELSRIG